MKSQLTEMVFNPKKTKLFWLYFVLGAIIIVSGIMLMPAWQEAGDWCFYRDWGMEFINIIIAICIGLYLFLFLIKKVAKRTNEVIKILTIIEFVSLLLIALGCILKQLAIFNVGSACQILGIAMWARGVVEVFRAYYHQHGNNDKYPIVYLILAIVLVTFGAFLYAKPFISDEVILWIFVSLILVIGIIIFIDGFLAKPEKKKAKSKK